MIFRRFRKEKGHEITAGQPVEVRNQEMTIQIITAQNTKKRGGIILGLILFLSLLAHCQDNGTGSDNPKSGNCDHS